MRMYYAKFPNSYLADIVQHGKDYLVNSALKQRVRLHHSRKFYMGKAQDRVDLYRLVAQLLTYLVSGRSHVGYLYNYDENPIHEIVRLSFSSILRVGNQTLPEAVSRDAGRIGKSAKV